MLEKTTYTIYERNLLENIAGYSPSRLHCTVRDGKVDLSISGEGIHNRVVLSTKHEIGALRDALNELWEVL